MGSIKVHAKLPSQEGVRWAVLLLTWALTKLLQIL
jgi:hypothetical protein